MQKDATARYLTSGDVARLAGVSPQMVRLWEGDGKLRTALRTAGGMRLFERGDVERFLRERNHGSVREG